MVLYASHMLPQTVSAPLWAGGVSSGLHVQQQQQWQGNIVTETLPIMSSSLIVSLGCSDCQGGRYINGAL
ncbi:hypothetical protein ACLKA6_016688 [Drosophila palustris]